MARSDTAKALMTIHVLQTLTLIPCWEILAVLVNNIIAPAGILCLFNVSLLASIWAAWDLITQIHLRDMKISVVLGDLVAIAGLIAGVVLISKTTSRCTSGYLPQTVVFGTNGGVKVYTSGSTNTNENPVWSRNNNHCDLAKAAMGLGATNIMLFFISARLVFIVMVGNIVSHIVTDLYGGGGGHGGGRR